MRTHVVTLALFIFAIPALGAGKDLTLRQRTTGAGTTSEPHEEMQYWTATKRITDGPHMRMILDVSAKTMTFVDKDKKTYRVQTFDQMHQQIEAAKKQMESLPPQAREMMEKMTGGTASVNLKPTGKTEKIAGYEAKEYLIEGTGPMTGSVWITEALQIPMDPATWEQVGAAMAGPQGQAYKLQAAMAKLKGLPLRTSMNTMMGPQKVGVTNEVIEVQEKSAPPEVLTVPEGFKKLEAPPAKK